MLRTASSDARRTALYGAEATQVVAADRNLRAAQVAFDAVSDKLEKSHLKGKKLRDTLQQQQEAAQKAQEAVQAWGQGVLGLLDKIRELDAKIRDAKLSLAEEVAQLRDAKIATGAYTEALADNAARTATATSNAAKAALAEERMGLLRRQAQAEIANLQQDLEAVAPLAQIADSVRQQLDDLRNVGRNPRALLGDVQDALASALATFRSSTGAERGAAAQEVQALVQRSIELASAIYGEGSGQVRSARRVGIEALTEVSAAAEAAAAEAERLQKAMRAVNEALAARLELEQTTLVDALKAMRADLVTQLQEALPGQNIAALLADPVAAQLVVQSAMDKKLGQIVDTLRAYTHLPPLYPQANGGDYVVRRPTLFLAGEAGPERATFQPLRGRRVAPGSDAQAVTIQTHVTIAPAPGESLVRARLYGRTAATAAEAEVLERLRYGELGRALRKVS
jgi:hypothetical protein